MNLQNYFLKLYTLSIRFTYNLAIIILILVLAVILIRIVFDLGFLISEKTIRLSIKELLVNVLSLIVILELVRAFVEYFEHHRLRMEVLLETLIAFSIREFMIFLFEGHAKEIEIFYWTLGIFLLVLARSLAIVIKPSLSKGKRISPIRSFRRNLKGITGEK
ncbi:hypothetical protein THC_0507 [Caldimicrobium thiodismutans]|uniref:Phosphate-starvation-inducible E n=1 Tax=Caldimicrobium thiodismutans TaxID=1653476 RepID=A0A0U5BW89_9BACT|nr:phosphate-starvation-inducible PsiE family protein [Caldimicrobium thiodismutans]BAU22901.1 hypothetical protein THC_0507 [Caldimicrobium thiodismutans]